MPLDAAGARRFYDRIGRLQDTQRFYEDRAVRRAVELGELAEASAVFELGCGTGHLAADLLADVLPSSARYLAVDVSGTMVRLATERLAPWAGRASVQRLEPPAVALPGEDGAFDRFLATYVLDLLPVHDATALVAEAARLLAPGGLLALVSLTTGTTPASRVVCAAWNAVALRVPDLVGGCRPIELTEVVTGPEWRLLHRETIVRFAVASEVLVARRQRPTATTRRSGGVPEARA